MASPPSSEGSQGGGLGHSTPLVTVSNVHSGVRRSTGASLTATSTPAGADHPLAAAPAAPSPAAPSDVELSERGTPIVAPPPPPLTIVSPPAPVSPTIVSVPPPTTSPPPPSSDTPSTTARRRVSSPVAKSLDDLADAFLSAPSIRTSQHGLPPLLRPPPLPRDEQGLQRLRTLVMRRAWGDVLHVAGELLRGTSSPQHASIYASLIREHHASEADMLQNDDLKQETVEALLLECHALVKLRRYADLGREVERWNFVKLNDPTASSPAWVPWSLHILAAESLQYTDPGGKPCTDGLFSLRERLQHKGDVMWLPAVDSALSNVFVKQKEWRLALAALDDARASIAPATQQYVEHWWMQNATLSEMERQWVVNTLCRAYECEICSRQGRILLEAGALEEASTLLEDSKAEWSTMSSSSLEGSQTGVSQNVVDLTRSHRVVQHAPAQVHVNDGLVCFARSNYDGAVSYFQMAIDHQRAIHDGMTDPLAYQVEEWVGPAVVGVDSLRSVLTQCWNNMALCALYTCRMRDAVGVMEAIVRDDPTAFLTERLAFNLCTLYELGSDTATSARRKRVLQLIAKRFFLHDIGPESFRIN